MAGLESLIQKDVINWLIRDERVGWVARCNTGSAMVKGRRVTFGLGNGTADIIGELSGSGKFAAIEIKTPTGRVSDDQVLWLSRVAKHGGFACVVRSVDDIAVYLNRFTNGETGSVFGL